MHFQLSAPIKLMTLNQAFITLPNGRRCRSKEYTKFAQTIANLLMTKQREFREFEDSFDEKKHALHAKIVFYTPDLFTKKGTINKKSTDTGNVEKCLLDNVLVGKIDDSAIVKLEIEKLYGDMHLFILDLNIVSR